MRERLWLRIMCQDQLRCPPCPTFTGKTKDPKGKGKGEDMNDGGIATAGAQSGGHDA